MLTSLLLSLAFAQSAGETPPTEGTPVPEAPVAPPEPEVDPLLGEPYTASRKGQVKPGSKYWDLEVLYHQQKNLEGAELAEKRYRETGDPHLTLFVARSYYQYLEGNEEITDKKERMEIYERALAVLEEGMAKAPEDVHLKFAYGVLMGRIGTTRGVLASLRTADDIENAWLATVNSDYQYASIGLQEELPCDGYLALGIFYRLVPDSWLVKAISGTKGDLDKSLEMQEKGAKCAGDRVRNLKELAVTQMCIGTKRGQPELIEAGRKNINHYLSLPPSTQAEVVDFKHGALLLGNPDMACGYSRDGQQDLDEAKIQK
ncbi:MAG: hypothetical protein R3F61_27745 [Myxococcota bacterium]